MAAEPKTVPAAYIRLNSLSVDDLVSALRACTASNNVK
jgi:hypothetical protein